MNKSFLILLVVFVLVFLAAGCSPAGPAANPGPEKPAEEAAVVETFYNAILNHDRDAIATIACADWEKEGKREVDAFAGTTPTLVDFACRVTEKTADGNGASVACTGKIAASYGAEITDFPLTGRVHSVVRENGEWRICGFE